MPFFPSTTMVLPTWAFLTALTVGLVAATATAAVAPRAAMAAAAACMGFMPPMTPARGRAFPAAGEILRAMKRDEHRARVSAYAPGEFVEQESFMTATE